ncbi:Flp family type IVb pilin [Fulvimarina sp. MAC3]|uniref:Flp family type IVb pilin n=1 Tax=Fulvimarina sp. MAC3 TaxID=3148887 RepID=UPI0031FCD0F0
MNPVPGGKNARSLLVDRNGATAIEYSIIAGIIGVGLIAGLAALDLPAAYAVVSQKVADALGSS